MQQPTHAPDLFDRLWVTRAGLPHPLDAEFLDSVLRPLPVAERDLRWTEWIRRGAEGITADLEDLEQRWRSSQIQDEKDQLRARWVMWTLTSTVRLLRDHATRALYWFGLGDPAALFTLVLDSLTVNDPYVPERMLAVAYGVSMSNWADPRGTVVRDRLPGFARTLVERMFVPGAPTPSRHVLLRDYALGIITLGIKVDASCVPEDQYQYLAPPFAHLPSPFPPADQIAEPDVAEAEDAIRTDFGNYTIGRLVPKRRNYDYENGTYQEVLRQIKYRILDLGYSLSGVGELDRSVGRYGWRGREDGKIDRYGKKYAWVAFFEMYGLRQDEGTIDEWRMGRRSSDAGIDPSFPEPAHVWKPELPELFEASPEEPRKWLTEGASPNYDSLLQVEQVDGNPGPWVLLNGFVEQTSSIDSRRVFTFLRGLLVTNSRVERLINKFNALDYPGNGALPEQQEDHFTFAGEVPWSTHFGTVLRDAMGRAVPDVRDAVETHNGERWVRGIPVEVPVYGFGWESYHSPLNQVSGITVLAPALCERLGLVNWRGEWDLYDDQGSRASLYREFVAPDETKSSHLLYIRADLLTRYLKHTHQRLLWCVWGERNFDHRADVESRSDLYDIYSAHAHIHRYTRLWEPDE